MPVQALGSSSQAPASPAPAICSGAPTCPGAPQKPRINADTGGTPCQLVFASDDDDDVRSIGEDGEPVSIGPHPFVTIDMHSSRQTSAP